MHRTKAVAILSVIGVALAACSSPGASGGGGNVTLTIAAVQGVEDTGLKALAPMYESSHAGSGARSPNESRAAT